MKKLFNRTNGLKQKWNGYDEDEFDRDNVEEISDDDAYYTEEDGFAEEDESYYAEEDGFAEEDESYYAEEDGFAEEDESHYAEEDGFAEDDESYYAEEDGFSEGDESYYAEEDGFSEDAESHYAEEDGFSEGDESYYAEEDGFSEDAESYYAEEDGFSEDAESYYAEEDDFAEDDAEDAAGRNFADTNNNNKSFLSSGDRKKSFWTGLRRNLARMGRLDWVIMGTGAAVLVLVLVTAGLYINNRLGDKQISGFVSVGTQLDGIDTIGEAGLLAVADAQMAQMAAASMVAESEDEDKDYNEQDYQSEIQVVMEYTSIQRDLKIKFVNKKTGKLIANVPFAVNVTDPDGKSFIWSDDDMDGIIYKKDITPGSYKLAMEALSDEKYSRFTVSTAVETATVKKDIEYTQVDVDNEVKSEDEVNVSQEDTKVNETVVESTLQDTVAWVESTMMPASYIEVPRNSIIDPKKLVDQTVGKTFMRAANGGNGTASGGDAGSDGDGGNTGSGDDGGNTGSGDDGGNTGSGNDGGNTGTTDPITVTLDSTTVSLSVGQTKGPFQAKAKVNGVDISDAVFSVISPSDGCAKVTVTGDGKVTVKGEKAGTAPYTIRATAKDGKSYGEVTLNVTVTAAKTITLDKTEITVFTGEPVKITATVTNAGTSTPQVKAESSNANVLKVEKCENNVVTIQGLQAADQAVTVKVTYTDGSETISAECRVKVKSHPRNDTTTKLKDANGVQLYVKVDEKTYREAVYADFYNENIKLYMMGEMKYTGWQTIDGKVYFFTAEGKKVTGEQVIQGAKYNFASDGSLVTGSGALGIDVSKWNGNIDWNAVKNSGINYVIIRCGYRGSATGSLVEDPNFVTNIKGATAVGLKVGVYFFSQAIDEREAVEEASMVISQIRNYKISYPVFLDVESSGGRADSMDNATRTAVCKAFCQTINNAGYNAGVYANKHWWETKINAGELTAYKIWLAQYATTPTYTGRYDLWQYRSTGRVSGISGDVDMNLSYLGY